MSFRRIKALCVAAMMAMTVLFVADGTSVMASDTVKDNVAVSANDASIPAGYYRSELTNELTPITIQQQRPLAVMVDNEVTALPHYGVNDADIVYEMVNSTANGRITRLMCIYKNWQNISQMGSIRSTRPTNFLIAAEYNAILCHDGGPFYNNTYLRLPYTNNLSGGFARFSNGKRTEYTEYITLNPYKNPKTGKSYAGLLQRIQAAGYSTTYNEYSLYGSQPHFNFSNTEIDLAGKIGVASGAEVDLPFPHNKSQVIYNPATKTYDYYEYGKPHIDSVDNKITTFKNVIIMKADMAQLDKNGYMIYGVLNPSMPGYYLTDGKIIPISWSKISDLNKTEYYDASGAPLTLNTGKTYIAIVPSDAWNKIVVK